LLINEAYSTAEPTNCPVTERKAYLATDDLVSTVSPYVTGGNDEIWLDSDYHFFDGLFSGD
jgi:hypothetical protein